jgi:hypothetical protein
MRRPKTPQAPEEAGGRGQGVVRGADAGRSTRGVSSAAARRQPPGIHFQRSSHVVPPPPYPRQVELVGDDWRRWRIRLPPAAFDDGLPGGRGLRADLLRLGSDTGGGGYVVMEARVGPGPWEREGRGGVPRRGRRHGRAVFYVRASPRNASSWLSSTAHATQHHATPTHTTLLVPRRGGQLPHRALQAARRGEGAQGGAEGELAEAPPRLPRRRLHVGCVRPSFAATLASPPAPRLLPPPHTLPCRNQVSALHALHGPRDGGRLHLHRGTDDQRQAGRVAARVQRGEHPPGAGAGMGAGLPSR